MRLIRKRIKVGKTEMITAPDKDEEPEKPGRAKVVGLMVLLKRSVQRSGSSKQSANARERTARRKSA